MLQAKRKIQTFLGFNQMRNLNPQLSETCNLSRICSTQLSTKPGEPALSPPQRERCTDHSYFSTFPFCRSLYAETLFMRVVSSRGNGQSEIGQG